MEMQTRACLLALGLWGLSGAAVAEPETFRCHHANGGISFQQTPCPVAEMSAPENPPAAAAPRPAPPVAVKPAAAPAPAAPATAKPAERPLAAPAAAPATATASPEEVKPTKRKRDILELAAQFERCRADAPGFAEKSAPVYAAWTQRHAAVLSEYDRLLTAKVRAGRRGEATLPLSLCTEDWLRQIEPLTRTPDPRFHTVEKTWQVFMGALMTGDRAAALSCMVGKAESRWKQRVEKMSDEELRRIAASIRALKVQWGDDYEKEGVIADTDNRVVGVAFRNVNEEWKITEFGGAAAPLPAP
jgi:hypothetical protein